MRIFKTLKLGIIGHGFVGKATDWGFNKRVEKFIVDPLYSTNIDDLSKFDPKLTFICVPTPMDNDGTQDSSIIESAVEEVTKKCPKSIIVIKSTVLPSVLEKLEKLNNRIIYNPEFLREKHANEDFVNSKIIIFGGDRNTASKVSKHYLYHSRCNTKDHIFLDISSASLIKYSINTFLATKVIFFNEIHQIFKNIDSNDSWESIIATISMDKRMGESHMSVPGHDGRLGFGGACFPKDSLALLKYAETINEELKVLKSAVKTNNKIRSKYDDLDEREKEQNVSFDDKI
tara:strand:+ start:248 stop:1111 length:864 start_codon:yes stop_codon:yes gene_type:complete